jgi:hypothetical protein
MVASADPESLKEIVPTAPLPPQRPRDIKLATAIMPDAASDALAAIVSAPAARIVPGPAAILGYDETAAAKSLFDPRTAFLDLGFESHARHELSATRFTGPAVKPLPIVGEAQAELLRDGEFRRPAS